MDVLRPWRRCNLRRQCGGTHHVAVVTSLRRCRWQALQGKARRGQMKRKGSVWRLSFASWVPATEIRGAGFFIQFKPEVIKAWLDLPPTPIRLQPVVEGPQGQSPQVPRVGVRAPALAVPPADSLGVPGVRRPYSFSDGGGVSITCLSEPRDHAVPSALHRARRDARATGAHSRGSEPCGDANRIPPAPLNAARLAMLPVPEAPGHP